MFLRDFSCAASFCWMRMSYSFQLEMKLMRRHGRLDKANAVIDIMSCVLSLVAQINDSTMTMFLEQVKDRTWTDGG